MTSSNKLVRETHDNALPEIVVSYMSAPIVLTHLKKSKQRSIISIKINKKRKKEKKEEGKQIQHTSSKRDGRRTKCCVDVRLDF